MVLSSLNELFAASSFCSSLSDSTFDAQTRFRPAIKTICLQILIENKTRSTRITQRKGDKWLDRLWVMSESSYHQRKWPPLFTSRRLWRALGIETFILVASTNKWAIFTSCYQRSVLNAATMLNNGMIWKLLPQIYSFRKRFCNNVN